MSRNKTSVLILCALALCATPVLAGPLATDPAAYNDGINPQWHGSTPFDGFFDYPVNKQPSDLHGVVDWAVYAPGTMPAGYGFVPANPGDYVYAYQVNETGGASLSNMSVSLEALARDIGSFTGNGGNGLVAGAGPAASYFFPNPSPDPGNTSANWDFAPGVFGLTRGLVFTSPFAPQNLDGSTLDDGSIAAVIPLPSPNPNKIPEPGTLALASCGVAVFALQWLRRRGRKASL